MDTTIIRTRTANHFIDEFGIAHIVYHSDTEETLADAEENMRVFAHFMQEKGKRHPLFIDIRKIKSQSREVRNYYAGPESAKVASAAALFVESKISTLVGNFFLMVADAQIPLKIFSSEAPAIDWLKGYRS